MRQLGWFRRGVIKVCAPWQHWSVILMTISVSGTLLAAALLIFDGWIDALALYIASALMLAVLLSQLAGQQAKPQMQGAIDHDPLDPGAPQAGLILKPAPRVKGLF